MTRTSMLIAVALLIGSLLSGCVIVPLDGWHGGRGHFRGHSYPHHHRGR